MAIPVPTLDPCCPQGVSIGLNLIPNTLPPMSDCPIPMPIWQIECSPHVPAKRDLVCYHLTSARQDGR